MIKTRLIKLLEHAKKYIYLQVLWKWLSLLAQTMIVYSLARILEDLFVSRTYTAVPYLPMIAAGIVIRYFCVRLETDASYKASVDVKRILRNKIYEKMVRLGASYRSYVRSSEIVQMSVEGVEQLETYFGQYLSQFFYALLAPVSLFAITWFIDRKTAWVLLAAVPLIPMSIMAIMKIARKLLDKYFTIYYGLGDHFLENLHGMTTLKIYQADEKRAEKMDEESEYFRRITMKVLKMQLISTTIMDVFAYGGASVGMIVALKGFFAGTISLPGMIMVILLAAEFFLPMRLLGSFFHVAMNGMTASDRIFALLDLEEPAEGNLDIAEKEVSISVEQAGFTYDPPGVLFEKKKKKKAETQPVRQKNEPVLHEVSFLFPAGSFSSIVGVSGCGKSTLAGILAGTNRGYTGHIFINGKELSQIREDELARHVTLVSHDSYLFKGSVKENLLMGKPQADDRDLIEALRKVNLWDFLNEQQGLDTELLENGANFSGGQRQRLALARALLHESSVYIFDEATSNIDMESEQMILDAIKTLKGDKTIILITHRLANALDSDCVFMMEEGRVSEFGTHEELMDKNGAYARLYREQKELEDYGKEADA